MIVTNMPNMYLFYGILLLITCIFIIWDYKEWNNERCKCGEKLEFFAVDSQGNSGYFCRKCDRTVWISWVLLFKGINRIIFTRNK